MKRKTQLCTRDNIELIAAMIVAKGTQRAAAEAIGIKVNTLEKWIRSSPVISCLVKQTKKEIAERAYTDVMQHLKKRGRDDLETIRKSMLISAIGQAKKYKYKGKINEKGHIVEIPGESVDIERFLPSITAMVIYIRLFGDAELRQYVDVPRQAPVQVLQQNIELSERELKKIDKRIEVEQMQIESDEDK